MWNRRRPPAPLRNISDADPQGPLGETLVVRKLFMPAELRIAAIDAPRLSIVIPTYREVDNLPVLVPRIDAAVRSANIDYEVIVVDDNSRDGTEELCGELATQYPLTLKVRTSERGLSSAVVAGVDLARGETVLVMDADLSHPPEAIPQVVEALDQPGVQFVIGSRYVAGGATAGDWGLFRWVNSKVATLLARPLTDAADPMAGFFALRRADVSAARSSLDPIGYKIGLELIVKCGISRVAEVPIYFADRFKGESKLNWKEQVNYLRHLTRLYAHRYEFATTFLKFAAVGATGFVVDCSVFLALFDSLGPSLSRATAIGAAMTWNFFGNRRLTFQSNVATNMFRQYFAFCLSCMLGAIVNWGVSVAAVKSIPWFAEHPAAAVPLGVLSGMALNYLLCRAFVFRSNASRENHAAESVGADGELEPSIPHPAMHRSHDGSANRRKAA